ncbi:hypothetical protein C8R45DRAFT_1036335 [Mycena sanguinolenta]|nr:hypothetical protein C8R45DRAFT_1036335 [Mycena sanguinolenta]
MSDFTLQDSPGLDSTFVAHNLISRCVFLAGFVILVYDHLLTLDREVKHIWSTKLRLSTCWFLVGRYAGLVGNITVAVWHFADLSLEHCINLQRAWMFLIILLETFVEATLAFRVFAMYGLNRWILACLLVATGFIVGAGLVTIVDFEKDPAGHVLLGAFTGCATTLPRSAAILPAAVWEATLGCDILVFVLTVRRAFTQRSSMVYSGSLIRRMAADGSMYFGLIILSILANVLSFYLEDDLLAGLLSWFTTSLSLALLSRLMLNLHDAGSGSLVGAGPDSMDAEESIHFAVARRTVRFDEGW